MMTQETTSMYIITIYWPYGGFCITLSKSSAFKHESRMSTRASTWSKILLMISWTSASAELESKLSATSFCWKRNISVEVVDLRSPHISLLERPRWSNSLYFIRMSGSLARSKSLLVPSFGRIQICIRSWCPCLWYMRVIFCQYVVHCT